MTAPRERQGSRMSDRPVKPMALALEAAERAAAAGEGPVGAVLVDASGTVLAQTANQVEALTDPTAHAELLALREAARQRGRPILDDCDLYVTLEPCAMCAGAIALARVRRLYFGAGDPKGGAVEHGPRFFQQPTCHHRPEVYGGIDATRARDLLRRFFADPRWGAAAADGAPADVAAAEALRPIDLVDHRIGALLRLAHRAAARHDVEDTAAVGDELLADALGAGVEDPDRRVGAAGAVDAADLAALDRRAGIALGREDDAQRRLVAPAQVEVLELAVVRRDQRRQQIALQPRQQHLAFGIAEAAIVFDDLRPGLGQDQPGVKHALVRPAFVAHGVDRRQDDLLHHLHFDLGRQRRRRRISAHAAGVGSGIAVADALVVLRRGEAERALAVDQREVADLLALEEILDDDLGAGGAEFLRHHRGIDGGQRLARGRRHRDALAGGQPVGFHHDRRLVLLDVFLGRCRIGEAPVRRRRNVVLGAEILRERLGAFERGGRGGRTEAGDAVRPERIYQTGDQRSFGADHHEVDLLLLAQLDDTVDVGRRHRDAGGFVGDARIARRAEQRVAQRRRRDRPAQGVLASARSDHQHPQAALLTKGLFRPVSPVGALLYHSAR